MPVRLANTAEVSRRGAGGRGCGLPVEPETRRPGLLPVGMLVMRYYVVTFPCLPVLGFRDYGQELASSCP